MLKSIRKNRKIIGLIILLLIMINSSNGFAEARKSMFKDEIPEWAEESIEWALEKELITGYKDETFKGDREISEAEFVVILSKYVGLDTLDIEGAHWAQKYYNKLRRYDLPLKGYEATKEGDMVKDQAMTRGEMARVIAAKDGFKLNDEQSVYFMYENKLSLGLDKEVMTYESYGVDKPVRRQEIPLFFKRIDKVGKTRFLGEFKTKEKNEIVGIAGLSYNQSEITWNMFNELAKKEGLKNPVSDLDDKTEEDNISAKGEFDLKLDMDEQGNVKAEKLEELAMAFIPAMSFEVKEDKEFKYIFKFNKYDMEKISENIDFEYVIHDIAENGLSTPYSTGRNKILPGNEIKKGKIKAEREMVKLRPESEKKEVKIEIEFKLSDKYERDRDKKDLEEIFIGVVYLEYNENDGGYLRFTTGDSGQVKLKNKTIDKIFEELVIINKETE